MQLRTLAVLATLALSMVAFAQPGAIPTPVAAPIDSFQVRYVSNLNIGDSFVNITNTGTLALEVAPVVKTIFRSQ